MFPDWKRSISREIKESILIDIYDCVVSKKKKKKKKKKVKPSCLNFINNRVLLPVCKMNDHLIAGDW